MQHFTPHIINTNSPKYNNFIYSVVLGDKDRKRISPNTAYHTDVSETANSFFIRDYNWEYFSNELEFE